MESNYIIFLVFGILLISLIIYQWRDRKTLIESKNTLQKQVDELTMANDEEYRIEVQSEDEFASILNKFEDPLWHIY